MKPSTVVAIGGAAVGAAGVAAALVTAKRRPKIVELEGGTELLFRRAEEGPFKEMLPGATQAVLSGDPAVGGHRSFIRFAPGIEHPFHTHTNDIVIVVLAGAYIYKAGGKELRVGPGSYLFIPGGTPHVSGSDPTEGALFYQESPGAFDLNPIEVAKA